MGGKTGGDTDLRDGVATLRRATQRQAECSVWESRFGSLCLGEMQMRVSEFSGAHWL